jgi:hypothetical protein
MTHDVNDSGNLIAWLEADEASSRPFRAGRLRLLIDEYGDEGKIRLFPGGSASAIAFEEARLAYLHGLFLGCIVLCQACVEHMLAGIFRMSGRDDLNRAGFQTLLREAREERLLSGTEFDLFDRLRVLRNPYAHPRAPEHPKSILSRVITTTTPFEDLLAQDAELAIVALLRLCRRAPFAL